MDEVRLIEVKEEIHADNKIVAEELRERLAKEKTFLINLMSSPGAGKTTFLLKTIEAVKAVIDQNFDVSDGLVSLRYAASQSELVQRLGLDKSAVSRRVNAAVDLGYLINEETRPGRPARLELGEPLPEDGVILPPPESLR